MHSRYRSIVLLIDPEGGNEGCPRKGEERQVCGQEMNLRLLQRLAAQRAPEEEDASKEFRRCNVLAVLAKRRAGKKAQCQRVVNDDSQGKRGGRAAPGGREALGPTNPAKPRPTLSFSSPNSCMLRFLRLRDAGQYQYRGNLRTPVNTHPSGHTRVTGFVTSRFHPWWASQHRSTKSKKTMRHFGGWLPRRANLHLTNPSRAKKGCQTREGGYSMRKNEPPRGQDSAGARTGIIAARAATVVCGKVALPTVGAGNARLGLNLVVPDPESDGLGPVTLSQAEAVVGGTCAMPMMRARTTNLLACYRHHWELRTNCKRSLDDSIPRLAMGQAGGFHVFDLPRSALKVGSENLLVFPPGNSTVIIPGMVTQVAANSGDRVSSHPATYPILPFRRSCRLSQTGLSWKMGKKQYGDDDQIYARWQSAERSAGRRFTELRTTVAISKAETIERANPTPIHYYTNGLTIRNLHNSRPLRMGGPARLPNASRSLEVLGQASCDSGITPTHFPQSQQPICASREYFSFAVFARF
ncbi:uncharacterized protein BO88DRAFT_429378 [Aspergillus vadensis CBS 113365]|uniref:Uncharacterized protein n=1 Tax=Aspergillus vadensis (strain CBS 113365 / IMI 142717 / IBT 24658) TaxID=1448311 RepID=A0A319BFC1_ASPVC|nr:hypothetical protein BO88DRAFT_429378 [Aspergillus vadensis CBS 113365]PYH64613.1 hypothetical protein BO88DRAFT_429378 [Aspergillus vadensis CBS 113365]